MDNLIRKVYQKTSKIKSKLYTSYCIDYSTNYKNSVFLAGTGRSGTTWVSNLINYRNNYRYIFEPFEPKQVYICRDFNPKQYIRPSYKQEFFLNPVTTVLNGKVKSYWSDRFNQKIITNKRLIKSVRANLFLKWLRENFPQLPIILLIRHPCAVAYSRVKLDWGTSLNKYLVQEDLMEDFLNPFEQEIRQAEIFYQKHRSIWENSIFTWCIEHYIPLKQLKREDIYIVFYEDFCTNPKIELDRIFAYINNKYDERVFAQFTKASQLSRKDSAVNRGESLINSWKNFVTDEQKKRAVEIIGMFNLERIYSQDSIPDHNNLYRFMES